MLVFLDVFYIIINMLLWPDPLDSLIKLSGNPSQNVTLKSLKKCHGFSTMSTEFRLQQPAPNGDSKNHLAVVSQQ
jgi:hypothetical protein